MRGIHHHARFSWQLLTDGRTCSGTPSTPHANQPPRAHDEERLACREPIAIGSHACDFAPALFGDTSRRRHAREHARLAREELHLTRSAPMPKTSLVRSIYGTSSAMNWSIRESGMRSMFSP